jgi:hypothetical protein
MCRRFAEFVGHEMGRPRFGKRDPGKRPPFHLGSLATSWNPSKLIEIGK